MTRRPPRPHHTAPCSWPTRDGQPCPGKAVGHHPEFGGICALHAHHAESSEGRTATILVRLSPEERQGVQIVADIFNVSLSDIARTMLLGLQMPELPRARIDAQAYGQLGRIGGILNQIAHALNLLTLTGDVESLGLDPRHLEAQLADLRRVLDEVRLGLAGAP